jgi:hypothetical protein
MEKFGPQHCLELLYLGQRLWEPSPGDHFLRGDEVDVRQGQDRVDELEESLLPMRPVEEPGRVEEEGEGGLRLRVVLQEILQKSGFQDLFICQ